jgi:hypothetical protein
VGGTASIYFFAGDFADVLKRHAAGEEQTYATHDEVALMIKGLIEAGVELTVYSFVTPYANHIAWRTKLCRQRATWWRRRG